MVPNCLSKDFYFWINPTHITRLDIVWHLASGHAWPWILLCGNEQSGVNALDT